MIPENEKKIGMFKNSYFIKHPRVTPSDNETTIYLLQIIANETSKINILNIVLSIRLTARGFQIYCFPAITDTSMSKSIYLHVKFMLKQIFFSSIFNGVILK